MKYADVNGKLADYRQQIDTIREKMRETLANVEPQEVKDYEFTNSDGAVRLSELFGHHEDLIVIHNMGVSCSYCTLWADGYNGIHQHVVPRVGFVVSSPDQPIVQQRFAESRGWKFPMVTGCRACPSSSVRAMPSCGSPTPASAPAMTSAHCGIYSISCRAASASGRVSGESRPATPAADSENAPCVPLVLDPLSSS
jgi:hypothetical protein